MKPHPSAVLLHRHHRQALWMRPLWIAVTGLAIGVALIYFKVSLGWRWYLLGATAVVSLVFRAWPRRTLRTTANALDGKLALNNRLEAVVELGERADPLAEAARGEVQSYLATHPWPRPYAWITGLIILALLLPANLAFMFPTSTRTIPGPEKIPMKAPPPPVPVAELPPPSKPVPVGPEASITWVKPEADYSASPKEEISLVAEAKSKTGLRKMTLHVALNGESRPPIAVPGEFEAGVKPVTLSLALETLEVRPNDIVTYYLQAEAIRPADAPAEPVWPPVVSPLQIVEIRPFRAEQIAAFDRDDPASAVLEQVEQLKHEQFDALREAFALGNGVTPRSDPQWRDLVKSVGERQTAMGGKIAETTSSLASAGVPREAADLLATAKTEMEKATAALARSEPADAVAPGTKAASRLAATAQSVARTIRENRDRLAAQAASEPVAPVADLPPRETTLAGQLEKLAAEQQAIAGQLASQASPPNAFETQDRVARAIASLAADPSWPKATAQLLNTAAGAAKEAAGQLNEKDDLAATEPATRAAQSLAEALANMDGRGRERATDELLAAQQMLNRAATDLQMATPGDQAGVAQKAAERTTALQQDLQNAARREQQIGSAEAAQNLNDLARRIAASNVRRDLDAVAKPPAQASPAETKASADRASQKMRDLAQQAAGAAGGMQQNEAAQEQAIADLKRAQENLNRIAGEMARPLRWVNPTSEIKADPTEKVSLLAQTNSEQPLSGLALQLTVNGNRRPPLPITPGTATGEQALPFTLALETLNVKADEVVSYMMTASRTRPGADGAPQTETVSTPVQMITIKGAKKEPDPKPKAEPKPPQKGGPLEQQKNPLEALLAMQRGLVERTYALEQSAAESRKDSAWQTSVKSAEKDQHTNLGELKSILDAISFVAGDDPDAMSPTMEDALKLLKKAETEMTAAEAAWKKQDPTDAAPPSVRAMAALVKLMESQNSSSPNANAQSSGSGGGGGGGGQGGADSPQQSPSPSSSNPSPEGATAQQTPAGPAPGQQAPQPGQAQPGESQNPPGSGPPSDPLGPTGSNQMTDLYETVVDAKQRSNPSATGGLPPPPGPGSRLKDIREYAGMLSQRIDGLIQQAEAAQNQRKRAQVLTTANPSEAPPAYRPAVEDYLEKLARDRRAPVAGAR
jgi:hypothetical protein